MQTTDPQLLAQLQRLQVSRFWHHGDFWIEFVVGIIGVGLSFAAFKQAEAAKDEAVEARKAATRAGKTVKLQTMTIELTDVKHKFELVQPGIQFNYAKDLFNEVSWRLRRIISTFADHPDLQVAIASVKTALDDTQESLKQVRPTDPEKDEAVPNAVYYGIEDNFATVNNCVADLLGLVERLTSDFGDSNATK